VGIAWAVPFSLDITKYMRAGNNSLKIEVTNLPANRIADYDKRKINWRVFKEINLVDRNYMKTGYGNWQPVESGLCSPVSIEVYTNQ
jgi:hypothetical protein